MLPPGVDMHGGRVDLLDNAEAPAIDLRTGHEHAPRESARHAIIGAEVSNASAPVADCSAQIVTSDEHVLVLAKLAVEDGCAERAESYPVRGAPGLTPEGLDIPSIRVWIVPSEERVEGRDEAGFQHRPFIGQNTNRAGIAGRGGQRSGSAPRL